MRAGSPVAWRLEGSRRRWRDRRPSGPGEQLGRRVTRDPTGAAMSHREAAEPRLGEGWAEEWKVPVEGGARIGSQLVWPGRAGVSTLLCGTQRHRMKATHPLPDARLRAGRLRGCPATNTQGQEANWGPGSQSAPRRDSMPGPGLGLSVMQRRWLLWLPGHPEPQEAPAGWLDLESSICPRSQLPPAESRCRGRNLKTTDARASAWVSISRPPKRHFSTNTLKDSVCGGDAPPHPPGKLSVPPFLSSP